MSLTKGSRLLSPGQCQTEEGMRQQMQQVFSILQAQGFPGPSTPSSFSTPDNTFDTSVQINFILTSVFALSGSWIVATGTPLDRDGATSSESDITIYDVHDQGGSAVVGDYGSAFLAVDPDDSNNYRWELLPIVAGVAGVDGADGADGVRGGTCYQFSTTITSGDPGTGYVRFNNATFGSITEIYIDYEDKNSVDMQAWYGTWDDSTSTKKGTLVFQSADSSDASLAVFEINSIADSTGFFTLSVSPVTGSGSPPFTANEDIVVFFNRTGDKGDSGADGADGIDGIDGTDGADGAASPVRLIYAQVNQTTVEENAASYDVNNTIAWDGDAVADPITGVLNTNAQFMCDDSWSVLAYNVGTSKWETVANNTALMMDGVVNESGHVNSSKTTFGASGLTGMNGYSSITSVSAVRNSYLEFMFTGSSLTIARDKDAREWRVVSHGSARFILAEASADVLSTDADFTAGTLSSVDGHCGLSTLIGVKNTFSWGMSSGDSVLIICDDGGDYKCIQAEC